MSTNLRYNESKTQKLWPYHFSTTLGREAKRKYFNFIKVPAEEVCSYSTNKQYKRKWMKDIMIDLGKCWKYKIKFSLWKTFRNISEKELSLWPPLGKNTCFSRKVNIYILYCFRISEFQYLKKIKELIIGE